MGVRVSFFTSEYPKQLITKADNPFWAAQLLEQTIQDHSFIWTCSNTTQSKCTEEYA